MPDGKSGRRYCQWRGGLSSSQPIPNAAPEDFIGDQAHPEGTQAPIRCSEEFVRSVRKVTRGGDLVNYYAAATNNHNKEAVMTTFQLGTLAVIAVAYLMGMLVRARRQMRAEARVARLRDAVDPARGSAQDVYEADAGHDGPV